jgi:hypothetical protein
MSDVAGTVGAGGCPRDDGTPVPPAMPGEFTVRLGEGGGGSLHDLADGLAGRGAGVEGLLSWLEWVEVEARGFDDLVEGLQRLRGAVMVAGAGVHDPSWTE